MIWTTIGLYLTYALLLKYWKNLSYAKFLPTSTLTIYTILVNQHIVQVTAQKQLFLKLFMMYSTISLFQQTDVCSFFVVLQLSFVKATKQYI